MKKDISLLTLDKDGALEYILSTYRNKGYAIVNFLYFYNYLIILEKKENWELYYNALNNSILLPDGIAIRLYFRKRGIKLYNLNGTDFIPYFLEKVKLPLIFYGAKKKVIEKVSEIYKPVYFQDGYSEFKYPNVKNGILLVGLGTPKQEIWLYENIEYIKNNNLIAFGVGGFFDFVSGEEKRAPLILRKLNLEWFRRLISKPKKNFKKVIGSFKILKYL